MKAVVTGGCGFIGSHVVERLLADGHQVTIIDNMSTGRRQNVEHLEGQIEIIEADIGKLGGWTKAFVGVDYVAHLAALADIVPSIVHPDLYYSSNVNGTFNVLQAVREQGIKKLVYAASSSCYGLAEEHPTPESAPINPMYPYALTKRMGEELVMHWSQVYKCPAISLRFFNVYGTRSRTSGTYGAVFGVFLAQKLANKPYTVVGDGEQTRDFTYVSDVADAVVTALYSDVSGETFNVGSGKSVSVNRIVELLGGPVTYIPKRPGEPDITFADISKIQDQLNWQPKVPIEDGVQQLVENIEYWRNAPVWNPESIAKETKEWFDYLG